MKIASPPADSEGLAEGKEVKAETLRLKTEADKALVPYLSYFLCPRVIVLVTETRAGLLQAQSPQDGGDGHDYPRSPLGD